MKRFVMIVVAVLVSGTVSQAADFERCKTIHRKDGRVYTVKASMHRAAHIILPEPIIGDPITGNEDLWTVAGENNHLWIKPTNNMKDGRETSVTVIGVSNNSYDFHAIYSKQADACIQVQNDGGLIKGGALSQWTPPEARENVVLRQQIAQMQAEIQTSQERTREKVENALIKYRGHIYTGYKWTAGSGFMGKRLISDVYDDGRWTYIRVANDNKGLLTVAGLIDGEKEMIEYDYDRESKIYKVVGIFPKLYLSYGKSEVLVTRADERTAGAF